MRTPLSKGSALAQFKGVRSEAQVDFSLLNIVDARTWRFSHISDSGNVDSLVYTPGSAPVRGNGGAEVPAFEVAVT